MKVSGVFKRGVLAMVVAALGVVGLSGGAVFARPAEGVGEGVGGGGGVGGSGVNCDNPLDCIGKGSSSTGYGDQNADLPTIVANIIRVVLYIVGILSVVFIIYGGVKYGTSAGDSAKVKSAKDTILYAVIGLIVAILAYAIVSFVTKSITLQ